MMKQKKRISLLIALCVGIIIGICAAQIPSFQSVLHFACNSPYLPSSCPLIHRKVYTLAYDGRIKSASWVYEELTTSSLKGDTNRAHFDFMEDPLIPEVLRATQADYKGSGFDRGHLCPAADAKASTQSMEETFYLSNISPQTPQFNRKYWLKLEKHVRNLTQSYDRVYAITGPLFLAKTEQDGKRYVRYEVIGAGEVAVPTHYFKVLHAVKGREVNTEAYIIPNEPIRQDRLLQDFIVTLEKVEKAAGIILNSKARR